MNPLDAITLYSYWRSSSAWRVRIALELKGVPYRLETFDLRPGMDRPAAFRQSNELGQVPVLEAQLEGQALRLTQSLAIIDLLDRLIPTPALYPAAARERAWAIEVAEIINSGIQPFQNTATQSRVTELGADAMAFTQSFAGRGMRTLEARAQVRAGTFSIGNEVSVADVLLVPQLYAARRFNVELSEFPTLLAVEQRCAALPAFIKAHPQNQPDCPESERSTGGNG